MNAEDTPAKPGRKPSGQVIARTTKNGPPSFSIRFTAYRRRHQLALGPQVTTRGQADMELANVLADVRRGTWRPPSHRAIEEPTNVPTFHEFASSWFERHRHEVRDRTRQYWLELLTPHLLPFFAAYPLDCITPEVVDSYKAAKLLERERWDSATPDERKLLPQGLGAGRINRSLALLARILEEAVEYRHISSNAAAGKKRKVQHVPRPTRTWLELHEVQAVLEAAGNHRAPVATMMLGGLRVGELIPLRWRDVDLAGGTIRVTGAKTDAGMRLVEDMSPMLREALTLYRADSKYTEPDDLVFCTARGTPHLRGNIRRRMVGGAVERANAALVKAGRQPIAGRITNHSLRRTYASLLYETGATPAYVMAQMGHTSPALVLEVYAKKMARSRDTGERMDALIRGTEKAQKGANGTGALASFAFEKSKSAD